MSVGGRGRGALKHFSFIRPLRSVKSSVWPPLRAWPSTNHGNDIGLETGLNRKSQIENLCTGDSLIMLFMRSFKMNRRCIADQKDEKGKKHSTLNVQ
jgi:hypothetical protein